MRSTFENFSQIMTLLKLMEVDLGIGNLSQNERNLLAAIVDIQMSDGSFESEILKAHPLLNMLAHASFFRALRGLQEKGFIEKRGKSKRSAYRLVSETPQNS